MGKQNLKCRSCWDIEGVGINGNFWLGGSFMMQVRIHGNRKKTWAMLGEC